MFWLIRLMTVHLFSQLFWHHLVNELRQRNEEYKLSIFEKKLTCFVSIIIQQMLISI